MFIINERIGKLTNFLDPSMIVAIGVILLSFIQNLIIAGLLIFILLLKKHPLSKKEERN